jgi:hypothetical protein
MVAGSVDARRKFTDMLTADAEVMRRSASSINHTLEVHVHHLCMAM